MEKLELRIKRRFAEDRGFMKNTITANTSLYLASYHKGIEEGGGESNMDSPL